MDTSLQSRTERRCGITLVEVMVTVAVTTMLAGVVVSLLMGLRDWDRDMRHRSLHNEQLARLGQTMRADIRQAADVSLPTMNAIVIRDADEKQTRYELSTEGCRRVVTAPADPTPRSDVFSVGPCVSWVLTPCAPGRRPMFAVTLNRGSQNQEKPPVPFVVHAALGSDANP